MNVRIIASLALFLQATSYVVPEMSPTIEPNGETKPLYWIAVSVGIAGIISLAACMCCYRARRNKIQLRFRTDNVEEPTATFSQNSEQRANETDEHIDAQNIDGLDTFEGKKIQMIEEIKRQLTIRCNAIQPIPYIKDRVFGVENIYIESGLELMDSGQREGDAKRWNSLPSLIDLLSDDHFKDSNRIILEGEPGYGKSTLALKLAYFWCTSFLQNVEIFILIRLQDLIGITSIYHAIKVFLLDKCTFLTESDIETVISGTKSVVIFLDGFDEYYDKGGKGSDIIKIIKEEILPQAKVIISTRPSYLRNFYKPHTKRIRLTGFDAIAQEKYMLNAVTRNDSSQANWIKKKLESSPILSDICQVPLFFVMLAHIMQEDPNLHNFVCVAQCFNYIITCFHNHLQNKETKAGSAGNSLAEIENNKVNKIAFDGITGENQQLVWEKKVFQEELGQECFEFYIRIGILVEEELVHTNEATVCSVDVHMTVRFYHKLFQEWYAAKYLTELAEDSNVNDLGEVLNKIDPDDLQYVLRFSCGMSTVATEKILKYLKTNQGSQQLRIFCAIEQLGSDVIIQTVRDICGRKLDLQHSHSIVMQRSMLQILHEASKNEIPIKVVQLTGSLSADTYTRGCLVLKSGLSTPPLLTLEMLLIHDGRELTKREVISVLSFATKCTNLKKLRFGGCMVPFSFENEPVVHDLIGKNISVLWDFFNVHKLDFESKCWMIVKGKRKIPLTEEQYEEWAQKFRELYETV